MKIILFIFCFIYTMTGFCQNVKTSTISWTISNARMMSSGDVINNPGYVVTYPAKVEWFDSNGTLKHSFSIYKTDGAWSNVAANGSISYGVQLQQDNGSLNISRTNAGIAIRIMIARPSGILVYECSASQFNLVQ